MVMVGDGTNDGREVRGKDNKLSVGGCCDLLEKDKEKFSC